MLEFLEQVFRQVRAYLHSERFDSHRVYAQTPAHTTMQFDREAEDIIISGLIESNQGFEIITEERPAFKTSPQPAYRIVIDPVDGSTNVARGIMTAGVALAVFPIDKPMLPETVEYALVGELFSGIVYQAQRGRGAFCNGRRCQVSATTKIQACVAGVNFDGRDPDSLHKLLVGQPALNKVRRTGSSAMDIVYVANGAYDAYIDVGDVITAESFLAPLSIVLEAGGVVSDQEGQPLRPVTNLTEGFSLVVTGTRELHRTILRRMHTSPKG